MNKKLGIGVIALTLAVAACSSDGVDETAQRELDEFNSTTTAPPDSTSTTSDSTAPTETEPPATDPVETPPLTDAASTTAAPTPSTSPDPADLSSEEAVISAVMFFEDQWRTCVSMVPNCDIEQVGERRNVEEFNLAVSEAQRFNISDYRTSNAEGLSYRVDAVALSSDGNQATVSVCLNDPISITEADGTVVDDRFISAMQEWTLILDEGAWNLDKRTSGELFETKEDNLCV